jgi:hypothetical protein
MPALQSRLGVTVSASEANRIRRAAALRGVSVAVFVRRAAVREADVVLAHPSTGSVGGVAARLRGRATVDLSADGIMRMTRGE